jgi:hypothetical protein
VLDDDIFSVRSDYGGKIDIAEGWSLIKLELHTMAVS